MVPRLKEDSVGEGEQMADMWRVAEGMMMSVFGLIKHNFAAFQGSTAEL